MTILIVDDHPIVRKGIHALLASAFADAEVMDASCLKEAEEACSTRNVNILTSSLKKHAFYNLLINNILYLCVT